MSGWNSSSLTTSALARFVARAAPTLQSPHAQLALRSPDGRLLVRVREGSVLVCGCGCCDGRWRDLSTDPFCPWFRGVGDTDGDRVSGQCLEELSLLMKQVKEDSEHSSTALPCLLVIQDKHPRCCTWSGVHPRQDARCCKCARRGLF